MARKPTKPAEPEVSRSKRENGGQYFIQGDEAPAEQPAPGTAPEDSASQARTGPVPQGDFLRGIRQGPAVDGDLDANNTNQE